MDWTYVFNLFADADFYSAALTVAELAIAAWAIAAVLGMFVALGRQSRHKWVRITLAGYVWFFRSLPLLVLLIFVYNAPSVFPQLRGLVSEPFAAGLIALVLSETAYISEIHRGGILSVAKGQAEAARALGLPWRNVQLNIVIPQAFRVALPTLGNELVTIVKLTSLVSAISLTELLLVGQRLYTANFKVLETLLVVAVFYVALVTIFDVGLRMLERRLDVSKRVQKMLAPAISPFDPGRLRITRPKRTHNGEVVIQVSGVTKAYGQNQVLRGVDLNVHRGEVVVIIGPSGSGKTTLIRTLNGLELIDGGSVTHHGDPVGYRVRGTTYLPAPDAPIAQQRRQIGMVFQQFNLFPHKTALANVTYAPVNLGKLGRPEAREMGIELLRKVGLEDKANLYPYQLSGGQQQRVAIARALAVDPEVVLFDEPTSALDPELVDEVLEVMARLADEGLTMVIVTHEMRFAALAADWAVFMDQGVVQEQGPADQVFANPQQPRTQAFLSRVTT